MLRGTQIISGRSARALRDYTNSLREYLYSMGFEELIIPAIWEQGTFTDKAGEEVLNQMYTFQDKKGRDVCLIPEVTAIVQEQWNQGLSKRLKKPHKVFYESRCYRYERPQAGRYREFLQFGVEILGGNPQETTELALKTLEACLTISCANYEIDHAVKRGLNYYTEAGFEARVESLGTQKQVAGGGRYAEGIGWAIGVERLLLATGQL